MLSYQCRNCGGIVIYYAKKNLIEKLGPPANCPICLEGDDELGEKTPEPDIEEISLNQANFEMLFKVEMYCEFCKKTFICNPLVFEWQDEPFKPELGYHAQVTMVRCPKCKGEKKLWKRVD